MLWVAAALFAASPGVRAGTILVYGDSLSAAYGLSPKQGWVALLTERLKQERINYSVVNASISGETSAGGANRIERTLAQHKPEIVVLELGANDGLRGLPLSQMRANLGTMINAAHRAGARVLLVGMRMPPNYGQQYTKEFFDSFGEIARMYKTGIVPFLLAPIAQTREYFQPDGVHPTAAAQPLLLDVVWKELRPMLRK
jgi:acyl-CoA thioesterase-1